MAAKRYPLNLAAIGVSVLGATKLALAQEVPAGNPEQGRELFFERNCVSCHGYSGETGTALLPLRLSQEAFVVIVRTPPMQTMPAYPDLSPEQVSHIYAYLKSVTPSSPEIHEIEILNSLRSEL